jgi:cell division protein FtsZ
MLINITGSSSLTLHDLSQATDVIREEVHEEANIIFGASIDDNMAEKVQITVIATGFLNEAGQRNTAGHMRPTLIHDRAAAASPKPASPAKPAPVQAAMARERMKDPSQRPATVINIGTIISEFADDGEYDIPTFVRRQQSL